VYGDISPEAQLMIRKEKIEVKVEDFDNQKIYLWTPEKFRDRY